ncbi:methyltransferase domain-containing protein [Paenibacillus elgii]|uniref:methyltransferase domain-containing protein n=1 Tax=Paenibacillus elgii TaxID=189691 RepID=UPI0013D47ECE|nr:methyltransferase domain-containing protein [Paenibacillus elgii]
MNDNSKDQKNLEELLYEIDNELHKPDIALELINRTHNDEELERLTKIIVEKSVNKVDIFNALAVTFYQQSRYEFIIPLLQSALQIEPFHKNTLINLAEFLAELGEIDMAFGYINQIQDKSEDVVQLLNKLYSLKGQEKPEDNIVDIEQNDVSFTGERIVINQEVKNKYNNVLEEHLQRYQLACQFVKDKIVLDAACGAGYGSKMMQSAGAKFVLGVDISEESLQNALKTYGGSNVDFIYGDVNKLPFENESFDIVVSFETIEHVESGSKWIEESSRVLKEDGLFLVSTPNRMISNPGLYFVEQPVNPYHKYEYTASEFIGELLKKYDLLQIYGQTFTPDYSTYHTLVARRARNLNPSIIPRLNLTYGHKLVSLGDVKDMQPEYLVAVCRKKRQ